MSTTTLNRLPLHVSVDSEEKGDRLSEKLVQFNMLLCFCF